MPKQIEYNFIVYYRKGAWCAFSPYPINPPILLRPTREELIREMIRLIDEWIDGGNHLPEAIPVEVINYTKFIEEKDKDE